jgi:hypothetical protein
MATSLPITIQAGALPPNVRWKPQQLYDAMVARMQLQTQQTYALFVSGSTEPSSNVGPWLRNGSEWWVWSDVTADYVPITVPEESLGYYIGSTTPDPTTVFFWIETTAGGSPLALKIYYSGAWTDVYATTLASYLTIAAAALTYAPLASPALTGNPTAPTQAPGDNSTKIATTAYVDAADALKANIASPTLTGVPAAPTAAPSTNSTQIATTAYVDAAIALIPAPSAFAAYPAQGSAGGSQVIPIDGVAVFTQVEFPGAPINPAPAPFDTAADRYIAPAAGVYQVCFACQLDNAGGSAAGMAIGAALYKNGTSLGNAMADIDNTPSPNGSRWSPGFSGLVSLAANDFLEVFLNPDDGVNAADITVSAAQLSVHRVSA